MGRRFNVSDNGPGPVSFRQLMALRQTGPDVYESLTPAWPPPSRHIHRAFGGHVYAQAVMAASKTVDKGMTVHNVTGHFILPGSVEIPFEYRVRRIRDGGIYCLRSVDVYQEPESPTAPSTPCFVATVSFKRDEPNKKWMFVEHQNLARDHLRKEYASVLGGKKSISEHPLAPGADEMWWTEGAANDWTRAANTFPGLETRKVDMEKYNGTVEPGGGEDGTGGSSRWRQLCFYRIIPDEKMQTAAADDHDEDDLNLHAAAHMYASDRNSLFLIPRALGYAFKATSMSSLAHTVIIRGPAPHLRTIDEKGEPKWFVQEAWTSSTGGNRGLHESRLWDYEAGRVVASTVQDGVLRIPVADSQPVKPTKSSGSKL